MSIRRYAGLCLGALFLLAAPVLSQTVSFVDANGSPVSTYLEKTRVHVRVEDPAANSQPWSAETVYVSLSAGLSGDFESLSLTETGTDTGVFEGSLGLDFGTLSQSGVLETGLQAGPPVVRDTITVQYNSASDTAGMVAGRIELVDDLGRPAAGYTQGDLVHVRVEDHLVYNDPTVKESILVAVNVLAVSDEEFINLQETGNSTGIFEGSIPAALQATYDSDGVVGAPVGNQVHAQHAVASEEWLDAYAPLVGSRAEILDRAGKVTELVPEAAPIRLRVVDRTVGSSSPDTLSADVSSLFGGDAELVTLAETGADTGVYEADLPTSLNFINPTAWNNGRLETGENAGPPHQFDTITLSYNGPAGASSDTATTYGSETLFVDEWGNDTEVYAVGTTVFIRVIDYNYDQSGARDLVPVTLFGLTRGDYETVNLIETGGHTGVFEGSLPIQYGFYNVSTYDGWLEADPGETIEVQHTDVLGSTASADRAVIRNADVHFFDEQGRPTHEVLEGGYASIRLYNFPGNNSPWDVDNTFVTVRSLLTGDIEFVQVTETDRNTGIFEGRIRLVFSPSLSYGNGTLEVSNSGSPDYTQDTVIVNYSDIVQASATTVGARIQLIDRFGQDAESYAVGDLVAVRVEDHNVDDPQVRQTLEAVVVVNPESGDAEGVTVTETGYDTGVFTGSAPSRIYPNKIANNGTLEVEGGDRLEARHVWQHAPRLARDSAVMTASSVLFVDAQNQPAASYLEASTAYVRLVYAGGNASPSVDVTTVTVSAAISADSEVLTLTETGGDTGIFTGSIRLATGSVSPNDGFLQTGRDTGSGTGMDTLTVTHASPGSPASDTAGIEGSRTWFVNAQGSPVDEYARNSRAYVRVEDQSANRPGLYDTVQVTVRSLAIGDQETLTLQETTRDSGVFMGSLPLETSSYGQTYASPGDGRLQSDANEEIEAVHTDWMGATSTDRALLIYASVEILDEAGQPTVEILEGGVARLRVVDPLSSPYSSPPGVTVRSRHANDQEYVALTETSYGSHVFESTIQLRSVAPGSGVSSNGVLETSTSGSPEYRGDELTASLGLGGNEAHAVTVPSRIRFIDGFGRVVSTFAVGERAGIRVEDNNLDDPSVRSTVNVQVSEQFGGIGDIESVTLTETGFDTNVYEGSIPLDPPPFSGLGNGRLTVNVGDTVRAEHGNVYTPAASVVQASVASSQVLFVDASGQPATVYLEGSRAYVRVADLFANLSPSVDSVTVTLRTTLGPDVEQLTLIETGGATGVFTGSIPLRVSTLQPNDGWLTTAQDLGTPHELDTLRAEYNGGIGAVATIGTISSRTWFIDAYGNLIDSYARGGRAYIRVEDHTADRPGLYDTVQVMVRSLNMGDQETISLLETGRDSGVFEGSLPLETSPFTQTYPNPGDGRLQSDAGEEIEAVHTDWTGSTTSSDRARIDYASVEFVDERGVTTFEVLEGGVARLRFIDPLSNPNSSPPGLAVRSRYGNDQEYVALTETSYGSHVFEGTIQLRSVAPGSGLNSNGVLETSTSGFPEYRGDEVTASLGGMQAVAVTRPSRVRFIDGFGQEVSSFAVGDRAGVRVEDQNTDDPSVRQTVTVEVRAQNGDVENLTLTETGFDTNIYEGSIATGPGTPAGGNNTLQVLAGETIEASYFNLYTPNSTRAQATMTGASVLFVDASGQPASVYLEGSRAYVRVTSFFANQSSAVDSVTVTLRTTLGPDVEQLTLIETGGATGVFTGSIPLRVSTLQPNDGWLTTAQDLGTPHEFDTLRAEHNGGIGGVATIGTISSRTWFIDAYGNLIDSYARGGRAYIRVEDHTADRPGLYDTVQATVRSLFTGDQETVTLLETARDGGVFEGSLPLETSQYGQTYPSPGDGKLQSDANEEIEAVHTDWTGSTTSADRARIDYASVELVDEQGVTTFEVLEGGLARLRFVDPTSGYGSGTPGLTVRSRYGNDQEYVTLAETSYGSHVFEGTIQLRTVAPGSGLTSNGILETSTSGFPEYRGDEVTVSLGNLQAVAVTRPSRVRFIDGFGQVVPSFAVGDRAGVRAEDHNTDDPSVRQTVTVEVRAQNGDVESLTLTETGFDTNVYEGSIPTQSSTPAAGNGALQVLAGEAIDAAYFNLYTPNPTRAQATMTGALVLFVDASGNPADLYLEASRAYVRVSDASANQSSSVDSVTATLRTTLGPDAELVTLTETGPATGVFTGSVPLRVSSLSPNDGWLTTAQDLGTPHEFDTLRAEYNGAVDTAATISSRTWFIDASGRRTEGFAMGSRAYVRVEDHTFDQPNVTDTVQVTLRSLLTGDLETLTLQEVSGGIFEGSLPLEMNLNGQTYPNPGDGKLQSVANEEIEAVHTDWTGSTASSDRATIRYVSVDFVDSTGAVTAELLEGGVARLRVFDAFSSPNSGPYSARVRSLYGSDEESVTLTETGYQSHVFEATVQLRSVAPGSGLYSNGVLETSTSGYPEYLAEQVTASYGDDQAVAVTVPSRVWFLNLQGQVVTEYAVGSAVRVRVEDHNAGGTGQIVTVNLTAGADSESVTLTETGTGTGLFEGSIPSSDGAGGPGNGVLEGAPGIVITAEHGNVTTPSPTRAQAIFNNNSANQPPTPAADSATTTEDQAVNIPVLANDTDPDNDTLLVASVGVPGSGTAVLELNGSVTFTPAADWSGQTSFSYTVQDHDGLTASATVTVTVTASNDALTANDDTATVAEDGSVLVAVLANDTDPDNDTLLVSAVTQGANGSVAIVGGIGGGVRYTPNANFHGADSFTYTASDGYGSTGTASVTVTVSSESDAPVANDDSATVGEDSSVSVAVKDNDTDADGDTLDVMAVTQGANGAVVLNADDTVTYTPNADFHGGDSFTYTVNDGNGGTDTGTVSVNVVSANDAPTAGDDTATTPEDTPVTVSVLANDNDIDGDTLTVSAVTQGTNGSVAIVGGIGGTQVTYTPNANFHGTDSFTYTASDGNGGTDTATVTVTINPTNDAPVADDDAASVVEDDSVTVAVLGNDSDIDGDSLTITAVTQGAHGAVAIVGSTITYTPAPNYNGTDAFTYTISDGNGGTDTATVTMTVTASNDALTAVDDAATVAEDGSVTVAVLANDTDPENDPLTVVSVTQGTNGAVAIVGNQVTYTPNPNFNGTDSFTYTASDGNGGTGGATVTVTVTPVNDAPVAGDDTASVVEDGSVTISVLGDDTDVDGDTLIVASVTQGTNGTVVIVGSSQVTYTPATNFHGTDSFTYTVSDGNGGTDTANVTVTVSAANDAPVANNDSATTAEDTAVTISVLTNDTDLDGDTLSVASVTQGANGAVTISGTQVVYTPGANFHGSDSFTYTVRDGNGGNAVGTVTVTVTGTNDAPVAVNDSASVAEDGSVVVSVRSNDTDLDGDTLTITAVTQGAHGSVTHNGSTVTYTPAANYNGSDSFSYTISDGNGGSASASVAVTITPVNDAPVAVNDTATTLAEVAVTVNVRANDTDIDSPTLTVTAVTQGAHGTVSISSEVGVTYTPAAVWVGPDAFTYTISDGSGGTATATVNVTVQAPARVTGNLQVLYTFYEGSGTLVHDVSGVGTPLNLTIANASAVTWLPGALSLNTSVLVESAGNATKVITACKTSNEVTVEAWVAPDNITQIGPAAIASIGQNTTKRDVTLGQSGTAYTGQLKTSTTGNDGTLTSTGAVATTGLTHVVYTRSSTGAVKIYVNGTQVATSTLTGNLSGWSNYSLALGGEPNGARYWVGDMHLVAIYSRALTAAEARQNWLAGAS